MVELKSRVLLAKPEDYKLPLSLSVSKTKTFKDCKAKYRFNYIEKLPQKDWEFLTYGKFLHEILERYYRKVLDGCVDSPNVILSASWKESFANWKPKLTPLQISEAKETCNQFLQQLAKTVNGPKVLSAEEPFWINIDDKILLNGFIDRTQIDHDGVLHVADYKTTKNKKYLKNDYFQLLTYAFVMYLKDPTLKKVRGSYILLRHNFEPIGKDFLLAEIMSVENMFLDWASKINNEKLFRPSPSMLCNYCSFIDHCEAGQRITGTLGPVKYGSGSW